MAPAPARHPTIAAALGPLRRTIAPLPATPSRRILVAVSGGADSMALLGLLLRLRRSLALELWVGHVDHGLRAAAVAEAALVLAVARAHGLPAIVRRLSLPPGPDLAARARAARRAALCEMMLQAAAPTLALGHTATDQAETVLLQLARGTGLAGLCGMAEREPLKPWPAGRRLPEGTQCVRPLLHLTRAQTRDLAGRLGLPFVDDPGNDDPDSPRVRVRTRVLPELTAINDAATRHIATTATIVRAHVDATATAAQASHASGCDDAIDPGRLRERPRARRLAAIRGLCLSHGLAPDAVAHRVLVEVDDALCSRRWPRRWDLAGLRRLCLERDRLWIEGPGAPADTGGHGSQTGPNH
ncbi:MAG: tRNA lysidine(34) synthetase TilS [Nannocystaceae bacterium]|nr:tRNA lysidine(34) synthetase TilS [Nannocystaceae bacterium]